MLWEIGSTPFFLPVFILYFLSKKGNKVSFHPLKIKNLQ